jgi:hypothetical protein
MEEENRDQEVSTSGVDEISEPLTSWMVPTAPLVVNEGFQLTDIDFEPPADGDVPFVVVEPRDGSFRGEIKILKFGEPIRDIPFVPPGVDESETIVPQNGSFRGERKLGNPEQSILFNATDDVGNDQLQDRTQSKAGSEADDIDEDEDDPMAEDQDLWRSKRLWEHARQLQVERTEVVTPGNLDQQITTASTDACVLASSIQMLGSLMGSSHHEDERRHIDSQEEVADLSQSIQKLGSLFGSMLQESTQNLDRADANEDDLLGSLLGDDHPGTQESSLPRFDSIVESLSAIENSLCKKSLEDDVTVHMANTTPRGGPERQVSLGASSFTTDDSIEETQKLQRRQAAPKLGRVAEKPSRKPAVPKRQGKLSTMEPVSPLKLTRKPAVPHFRNDSGKQTFIVTTPSAWKRSGIGRKGRMLSKFTGWTQMEGDQNEKSTAGRWEQQKPYAIAKRLFAKSNGSRHEASSSVGKGVSKHNVDLYHCPDGPKEPDTPRVEIIGRPLTMPHSNFFALSPLATQSNASLSSFCSVTSFQSPRRKGSKGCQESFDPYLHTSRGPCELCTFFLSDQERAQLDATGRHIGVMFTTGGCCGSCEIFPRGFGDQPARLCRMCYQNSHRKVYQLYTSKWSRRVRRPPPLNTPASHTKYDAEN